MGLDTMSFLKCELFVLHMFYDHFGAFRRGGMYSTADLKSDVHDPGKRVGRLLFLYWALRIRQVLLHLHALWPRGSADYGCWEHFLFFQTISRSICFVQRSWIVPCCFWLNVVPVGCCHWSSLRWARFPLRALMEVVASASRRQEGLLSDPLHQR